MSSPTSSTTATSSTSSTTTTTTTTTTTPANTSSLLNELLEMDFTWADEVDREHGEYRNNPWREDSAWYKGEFGTRPLEVDLPPFSVLFGTPLPSIAEATAQEQPDDNNVTAQEQPDDNNVMAQEQPSQRRYNPFEEDTPNHLADMNAQITRYLETPTPSTSADRYPKTVKEKPELRDGCLVFSLTDHTSMLIQKNLGGGKARCLVQEDSKSRIRNHQELVLLTLNGFLDPDEARALRRENADLADRNAHLVDRVRELRGYNDNGNRELWEARGQLSSLGDENKSLKRKVQELESQCLHAKRCLAHHQESAAEVKRHHATLLKELSNMETLKENNKALAKDCDRLRKERNNMRQELLKSKSQPSQLNEIAKLSKQLDALRREVQSGSKVTKKKKPKRVIESSSSSGSSSDDE